MLRRISESNGHVRNLEKINLQNVEEMANMKDYTNEFSKQIDELIASKEADLKEASKDRRQPPIKIRPNSRGTMWKRRDNGVSNLMKYFARFEIASGSVS